MSDNQPPHRPQRPDVRSLRTSLVIGAFIAVPIAYEGDFATAAVVQGIAIICGAVCAHGVKGMV